MYNFQLHFFMKYESRFLNMCLNLVMESDRHSIKCVFCILKDVKFELEILNISVMQCYAARYLYHDFVNWPKIKTVGFKTNSFS